MKLSHLIKASEFVRFDGLLPESTDQVSDPEITSIHYRSNEVRPGGLFFAIQGRQTDGHRYIRDAVSRGAVAVVAEAGHRMDDLDGTDAVIIAAKNTRKLLAAASSRFFGNPSEKLFLAGITGTNGKTTIAYLVEHILLKNHIEVGVISTINYRYHGNVYDNPLTTPESLDLQKILAEMASAGVTHVVMEVSSHGVAMDRICHCAFDMGIFTNLSQDHLDFHGSMEEYWACKKRFFTDYLFSGFKKDQAIAVINTDNPRGAELLEAVKNFKTISVGIGLENVCSKDISAKNIRFDQHGMRGDMCFSDNQVSFQSGLVGRYNIENILCAAAVARALDISSESIIDAIKSFENVPGRLERIMDPAGRHVFVDYAHTPGALENVLTTLKEIIPARLICVFGCGGDRDRAKRSLMGEIAVQFCDFVVITSDNPRTENPDAIIADIRKGISGGHLSEYHFSMLENGFSKKGYIIEADRERAIALGIRISEPGDTVLIAGKGHEDYQIIGKKTIAFDDREKAATALSALSRG